MPTHDRANRGRYQSLQQRPNRHPPRSPQKTRRKSRRKTPPPPPDGDIVLRKTKEPSLDETAEKIEKVTKEKGINVDELIAEAVEWARKSK